MEPGFLLYVSFSFIISIGESGSYLPNTYSYVCEIETAHNRP